jgi:hypothetical protein
MARSFLSQPTQVFNSENYDDTLVTGVSLQVSASSLEDDLNALRTQVRQVLWANVSGSWYDAITAPSGSNSARGLNTINVDLTDLEQKRFLFRRHNLNLVSIATGSNFAELSASLGTTPTNFAAVGASSATGSVVSLLTGSEGLFGAHSMAQVSGSTVITPRNLVRVRDAYNHFTLTSSNQQEVFGLIQVEGGTVSGDSFDDLTHRTQISFVHEITVNGTSSLAPASAALIGGKVIQYAYPVRVALDDIPEDAYLGNHIFIDTPMAGDSTAATLGDITLQRAIDNQVGTVTQNKNIDIALGAGFHWAFTSGSQTLWQVLSSNSEDLLTVMVDRIAMSSTFPTTFQQGISVATGSTQIDLGVLPGIINTLAGQQLVLSGGSTLGFSDQFGPLSTYTGGIIPFATATLEWTNFASDWGNQTSILGALHIISQSLSGSAQQRKRTYAGVTTTVNANTNITFPTNLDAQLGDYSGKNFLSEVNVFLNGQLLLPGSSVSDANDVYPGTSTLTGDLKFPMKLRSGSIISLEIF